MLQRAIALVSHGREIGCGARAVNLVMHRNLDRSGCGNKKGAEVLPRLHRFGSPHLKPVFNQR